MHKKPVVESRSNFLDGYKANFETLKRAFLNGDVAITQCREKATGRDVAVLVAVYREGEEVVLSPLAQMFDSNPYDLLMSPTEAREQDEEHEKESAHP
jgi:hypothetical protein